MRTGFSRFPTVVTVVAVLAAAAPGHPSAATRSGAQPRQGQIITIAGTGTPGYSGNGGVATEARVNDRPFISVAADGSVLVVDDDARAVRRIGPDGIIDSIAGLDASPRAETEPGPTALGRGNAPRAAVTGPDGSVYVTSDLGIARVHPDGEVTVVAGAGDDTGGVDGASAVDVAILRSDDVDVDAAGNLYVLDPINARIRRIDAAGTLTTVAGGGERPLRRGEGRPATEVNLGDDSGGPSSVEVDSRGTVYFTVEYDGAVFKVDPDGVLTMVTGTVEGFGGDGGPADDAALGGGARSITVDDADNLYIADGNDRIRMVDTGGTISTVGPRLRSAQQIAAGPGGDLVFTTHAAIAKLIRSGSPADVDVTPADTEPAPWADEEPGAVITIAGAEQSPGDEHDAGDGDLESGEAGSSTARPANDVRFGGNIDIAVDRHHRLYVADAENGGVDVVSDDMLEPFEPSDRALSMARVIATSATGDVFAVDTGEVVRVYPDGTAITVAGGGPDDVEVTDGQNALTAAFEATGIAVGADGTVYVADDLHDRLYMVGADSTISVLADLGEHGVASPGGVAVGADGTVYVAGLAAHRCSRSTPPARSRPWRAPGRTTGPTTSPATVVRRPRHR